MRYLTDRETDLIRVPKTAELVAARLRDRIIRGDIKEGDNLPPEAELTKEFAVSRPTLREAVRILEAEKLISVSRGARGGARVGRPDIDVVARYAGHFLQAQDTTIAEIYEAVIMIEPMAVAKLAEASDADTIQGLRDALDNQRALLNDPERWLQADTQFHRLLIGSVGNRALALVTSILQNVMAAHLRFVMGKNADRYSLNQAKRGIASRAKLIALIDAGKAREAQEHWKLHLENAAKVTLKTTGPDAVVDILGDWG